MSFEIRVMKFVERMMIWGRKREEKIHPDETAKLAKIDEAIAEVHAERAAAGDPDAV